MKTIVRSIILINVFIILTLITGYFTYKFFTTTKNIYVPQLKGKSLLEANDTLSRLRLFLKIEGEKHNIDTPGGYILRQNIPAGNKIKEGRSIGVILSKGPYIQYMPDFTGMNLQESEDVASLKKIKIKNIIYVHSKNIQENTVIAQRPAPDEGGGKDITLIVNSDKFEVSYYCPDFVKKDVKEAVEIADALGLQLKITGTGQKIAEQSPAPESIVKKGDVVLLKLSTEIKDWLFKWF